MFVPYDLLFPRAPHRCNRVVHHIPDAQVLALDPSVLKLWIYSVQLKTKSEQCETSNELMECSKAQSKQMSQSSAGMKISEVDLFSFGSP